MTMVPPRTRKSASQEWLGAESHLPNLNAELRRRAQRPWKPALPILAGVVFVTGVAVGTFLTRLLARSRPSR